MNSIVPYLQNQPTIDFHEKKIRLNDEFGKKAQIQGLVSYIYYPSQREYPLLGHSELEIEGDSWTLMCLRSEFKPLSKMITSSKFGEGFPFFRINIGVTPNQLRSLKESEMNRLGSCSFGVLRTLSLHGKYEVSFPYNLFPLSSFIYLVTAKTLGSRRINQIKFYGGKSQLMNLANSIPGVFVEATFIYSILLLSYAVCELVLKILPHGNE
ncbi:hypothetical protein BN1013_01694 [Candidatus Rubidus massiliensis]|nr:hypothetical protein BN1013_01694 [Candidatus Rubidus massiliensis]